MSELGRTDMADMADMIIIGGGPVGCCLALALRDVVENLTIIEPRAEVRDDKRTLALSESSRRYLERLGVWRHLAACARPVRRIRVSSKGAFGVIRIDSEEEGLAGLGWTVPFAALYRALRDELEDGRAVRRLEATVGEVRADDCSARVVLEGGGPDIKARMAAVTAGDAGALVRDARFETTRAEYGQSAVIVSMRTEREIGDEAYERFTEHGPMAVLPAADGACAVVWVHDTASANEWRECVLGERLVEALQDDFGRRLGRVLSAEVRAVYPLSMSYWSPRTYGRAVLLGAGAYTAHPVAAQGFNLGLRDVKTLAECVADGAPLGDDDKRLTRALAEWGASRLDDTRAVVRFSDLIARGFLKHWNVLAPLRGAAMLSLSLSPAMRRAVLRRSLSLASPPLTTPV